MQGIAEGIKMKRLNAEFKDSVRREEVRSLVRVTEYLHNSATG